ncbi:MAG TPA: hypothetical protein DC000_02735 [Clostridiales bacterium]|nr:hypothetical protein [Clostridiales bacterium]
MAKYTRIYEDGKITHEVTFRGEKFSFKMVECDCGMKSDNKGHEEQISKKFGIDVEELDAIGVSDLWVADEDEILETLESLEELES